MDLSPKRPVPLAGNPPAGREALRRILAGQDFIVETAAEYQAAVKVLAKTIPHLVCLDLTLPRESGFELCEHMRSQMRLQFVPILVISDRSSPEDMAHAGNGGANAFR